MEVQHLQRAPLALARKIAILYSIQFVRISEGMFEETS